MFKYDLGNGAELRLLQPHHARELLAFVDENRDHLSRWLSWVSRLHSVADAERFLQEGMDTFARDSLPTVGIWQGGRMAGGITFFAPDEGTRTAEAAYWLGADFSGQGLMTRALQAIVDELFETLQLERVQIRMEVENTRSRAVAERLGLTYEGIERGGWTHGGEPVDLLVYAIAAQAWRAKL